MSNTTDVPINPDSWTLLASGAVDGFITNEGELNLIFRENTTDPTESVDRGHTLAPKASINFSLEASQNLYARSIREVGLVVVTGG